MRATVVLGLASLMLAGCVNATIQKGMGEMVGKPLSAVTSKLGFPTDERTIAGQKVYIWLNRTFDEGTELKCQIRVIMRGDLIQTFDFEGDTTFCAKYAARLRT